MRKKLILTSIITLLAYAVISCNSKSEEYTYTESSSVIVSGFYLKNNPKVLDSLQNVFFSIDLEGARIFNADSLPYGTKVTRLLPSITTASSVSAVSLTYRVPETGRDSVVNYLTNSADSIDFSAGPVKLSVTSQNGLVTRDYEIRVNVHKVKSDSLAWYRMESAPLPTTFTAPDAQCTALCQGVYYCLTSCGGEYSMATTDNPASPSWTVSQAVFPFTADVESFRASDDALYILDTDGNLYSAAAGGSWTATGCRWNHIYGGYGDQVLGVSESNGTYTIESYPSGRKTPLPAGMPVSGTSLPATYTLPMGSSSQAVILGGRLPDGSLSQAAWAYDGTEWALMCENAVPYGLQDMTLVAYRLSEMKSSNWKPTSYPVLLAMGGRIDGGGVNRTVYYSRDWGITWHKGPDTVQLPAAITSFYGATGFCHTSTMYNTSRGSFWNELPLQRLAPQCSWLGASASRAVTPVTEWECPALYIFGGRNPDGEVLDVLWRGVILEFTFVPVI